jgi:hypothetical protein
MKRYVEASPRAKKVFFIVAFIWAGVALFLAGYDVWFPLSDVPQEQLVQISNRALVAVVVSVVFYLALSILVVLYTVWTVRSRQWPPHGCSMPFRTKVHEIKQPVLVWVLAGILLFGYMAHIGKQIYSWSQTNNLIHSLEPLLKTPNNSLVPTPGTARHVS